MLLNKLNRIQSIGSFLRTKRGYKVTSPEGYRFDKKLQVCVPIGVTRYYPYFGGRNGNGQDNQQSDDNTNNNTNGNGTNGNGSNGSGTNGNGGE